jgi:hypothetical protein
MGQVPGKGASGFTDFHFHQFRLHVLFFLGFTEKMKKAGQNAATVLPAYVQVLLWDEIRRVKKSK